jgi:hypothetical protein
VKKVFLVPIGLKSVIRVSKNTSRSYHIKALRASLVNTKKNSKKEGIQEIFTESVEAHSVSRRTLCGLDVTIGAIITDTSQLCHMIIALSCKCAAFKLSADSHSSQCMHKFLVRVNLFLNYGEEQEKSIAPEHWHCWGRHVEHSGRHVKDNLHDFNTPILCNRWFQLVMMWYSNSYGKDFHRSRWRVLTQACLMVYT